MMRIVAPFGFYGWGNIGDEATLNGFAQLLALTDARAQVWLGSRNPKHTARVEPAFHYFSVSRPDPRRWWAKLRASAHAFIGGTPVMDALGEWPLCDVAPLVRSIDRWKVPLGFVGVGIETLRRGESRRLMVDEIAPRVQHWSVRSERDRERLVEYGTSADLITVAADMAWLIDPVSTEVGRDRLRRWGVDPQSPLIGVNLVNENSLFDRDPWIVDALASALDELSDEMGATLIFLANEVREDSTFDKAAAKQVIARMKRADRALLTPNEYFSPRQMMSIISYCKLTISMRYHFCLFSTLQSVPFIAIRRSDKVSDLCWDMDWAAGILPQELNADELLEHGRRLAQDSANVGERLNRIRRRMRERALRNVAALDALKSEKQLPIRNGSAIIDRS